MMLSCSDGEEVFAPLSVGFLEVSSEQSEAEPTHRIAVRLNMPSSRAVVVHYEVEPLSAANHDRCGARDFVLEPGSLRFEPGALEQEISVRVLDDDTSEIDEQLLLRLVSSDGASLGQATEHRHTVMDDDRALLLDVRDFGATGDGETDDTEALQAALERARLTRDAVVWFPPGTYSTKHLDFPVDANYAGHEATLLRPPGGATDATTVQLEHASSSDSRRIVVQGLTLDGNRDAQGPFTDWEFQNSQLLIAYGDATLPGRLQLVLEGVSVVNTGGTGVRTEANVDLTVCDLHSDEVWTDALKMAGGNSRASIHGVFATASTGTNGMALQPGIEGFDSSYRLEAELREVELLTGDLEIDLGPDSAVTGTAIHSNGAPFFLRAPSSRVEFNDSVFYVGVPEGRLNRIVAPHDVTFRNCTFALTETVDPSLPTLDEQDRQLATLSVTWNQVNLDLQPTDPGWLTEELGGQSLRFEDCHFQIAEDVEPTDSRFVLTTIGGPGSPEPAPNRAELLSPVLEPNSRGEGYTDELSPECDGCFLAP